MVLGAELLLELRITTLSLNIFEQNLPQVRVSEVLMFDPITATWVARTQVGVVEVLGVNRDPVWSVLACLIC